MPAAAAWLSKTPDPSSRQSFHPSSRVILRLTIACAVLMLQAPGPAVAADEVRLRRVPPIGGRGMSRAVVVEAGALVHTTLLLPDQRDGQVVGGDAAAAQTRHLLDNLEIALADARTTLDHVVRLHVYVADGSVGDAVERVLVERFTGARPAWTLVEVGLPRTGALVAMDAVAATSWQPPIGRPARVVSERLSRQPGGGAHVAVQPAGPFVIVSGRAAPGEFDAAVRGTLEQLRADLAGAGLTFAHVVQIKSFVGDVGQTHTLQRLVAESFDGTAPPHVTVEWLGASLPVEIEVIAAAIEAHPSASALEFVEPIASRFSRLVRVGAGRPVFVSGLVGAPADPAAQVTDIFAQLGLVLRESGSDLRHLVKATYYTADAAADEAINVVRPTLYDPDRPPAASKISVRGTGRPGKGSTIDMMAITVER